MSRQMLINVLSQGDAERLWEFLYLGLFVPSGSPEYPKEIIHRPELSKYAERWGREGDFGFVGYLDNRIAGMIWARHFPDTDRGYGFVDTKIPELSMAILPQYRNQGHGSALLRRLLAEAQQRSLDISLSVNSLNPAKRLYSKFGFQTLFSDGNSDTMLWRKSS